MNYYSHNIGDYRRDTGHLSLLEHGIYRQLLDTYYLDEKPIPIDDAKVMRTHSVRSAEEMQALKNVLNDFFIRTEEGYIHKRCDIEIDAFHSKSSSASESAKVRWERVRAEKQANVMRTHTEGNANHKPVTNNHKPVTNKPIDADASPSSSIIKFDASKKQRSSGLLEDIDSQVANDFMALRRAKKSPLTETAVNGIRREAEKVGYTLEQALKTCCERGWAGFKAEWILRDSAPGRTQNKQEALEASNRASTAGWMPPELRERQHAN